MVSATSLVTFSSSAATTAAIRRLSSTSTSTTTTGNKIAVIGGGITGTLCSLVLKHRGYHPVLIDMGQNGMGGRLRGGVQFLRPTHPKLATVTSMLESEGLLQRWNTNTNTNNTNGAATATDRFGILGSSGGGYLPSSIVTMQPTGSNTSGGSSGIGGLSPASNDGTTTTNEVDEDASTGAVFDTGDFCHFINGSKTNDTVVPTYVGVPSFTELCPQICQLATIEQQLNTKVINAIPRNNNGKEGGDSGWDVEMITPSTSTTTTSTPSSSSISTFDGIVLATHDTSLASRIVTSIVDAEVKAGEYSSVEDALQIEYPTSDTYQLLTKLVDLSNALQFIHDHGRVPIFTVQITYSKELSKLVPFDAVTIPGSHQIQYLVRESSKTSSSSSSSSSTDTDTDTWTVITTSLLARTILSQTQFTDQEHLDMISQVVIDEVTKHLTPFCDGQDKNELLLQPISIRTKRWKTAFNSTSLNLQTEDSILLAPWRIAIGGDYIRKISNSTMTPLEASALSGLEAGERMALLLSSSTTTSSDTTNQPLQ